MPFLSKDTTCSRRCRFRSNLQPTHVAAVPAQESQPAQPHPTNNRPRNHHYFRNDVSSPGRRQRSRPPFPYLQQRSPGPEKPSTTALQPHHPNHTRTPSLPRTPPGERRAPPRPERRGRPGIGAVPEAGVLRRQNQVWVSPKKIFVAKLLTFQKAFKRNHRRDGAKREQRWVRRRSKW